MVNRPGLTLPSYPQIAAAVNSFDADAILALLAPVRAPVLRERWADAIALNLYTKGLTHPDEAVQFLHTLNAKADPAIGLKRVLVDRIATESRSFSQPLQTPNVEEENRLPIEFYHTAAANGILIARLFAATPAPHDESQQLSHIWKELVQPIFHRAIFVDPSKNSAAPGNLAILPALLTAAPESIQSYLLLREKGTGTGYVWYNDACEQPDEKWDWNAVLEAAEKGFNSSYRDSATYPAELDSAWKSTLAALRSGSDPKDKSAADALQALNLNLNDAANQDAARTEQANRLTSSLTSLASKVDRHFASAQNRFLNPQASDPAKVGHAADQVEQVQKDLGL